MARIETFDDFTQTEYQQEVAELKPFQFRDDKTKEGTLEWLNNNFDVLDKKSQSRLQSYIRWNYLYKGIHWRSNHSRDYDANINYTEKKPKMVNNFFRELIDDRVAQMSRLGSNFVCIPFNDQISDENNAKTCKLMLKARTEQINMDDLHNQADRIKFKYGTVFQFALWDKDCGDVHPAYKTLKEKYPEGIPKKILKELKVNHELRIGDVDFMNVAPYEVFPEAEKRDWKKVDHVDRIEWVHIEELKAEYPQYKERIQPNKRRYYDFETNLVSMPENMVMVRHFYHRKTKYLPEGKYVKYIDDVILEEMDLPFEHGRLPFIVDRDIIIENELWGRPACTDIEQMQRHYNNIDSAQARDLGVGSAPKWVAPKGSLDYKQVNNEFTLMEYKGPQAPQLVQNNPISQQSFEVQDRLERRMAKLMKVFDISRGNVPQGITANSALRFLDEQEGQAINEDQKKRKLRVREGYKLMLSLMSQYYQPNDGRMVRILGQDNEFMFEDMKEADFTQIYDIQLQNTSALPDTKTGKIAAIIDLNAATQTDPIFTKKEVVKMLDLANEDAFVDRSVASVKAAEQIFDALLKGKQVPEPDVSDDLLVYYNVFFLRIQPFSFKMKTPVEIKKTIVSYIKTMEGLLWTKAQTNPKIMMELQQSDYFPMFFTPNIPNPQAMQPDYVGADKGAATQDMKHTQQSIEKTIKEGDS